MTFLKLAIRSLIYHWRVNATVALGVAAATAVLTGALVIGDCVRQSLLDRTLDRLGRIDELLVTQHFFRTELVDELRQQPAFQQSYRDAVGVMLFPQATAERPSDSGVTRASNVLVIATQAQTEAERGATFWNLADPPRIPAKQPGMGEVILNRQLADELNVQIGDQVTIRLPKPEDIPADSPLGEKTDRIRSLPGMKVIEIIENRGLGRFSVRPSQSEPRNAYVALRQLQSAFRTPGMINAILVAGPDRETAPDEKASEALSAALHPSLGDLGLHIKHARLTFPDAQPPQQEEEEVVYDYLTLSSDRMILPHAVQQVAENTFARLGGQPILTYLANRIEPVTSGSSPSSPIPYSMVTAIDPSPHFKLCDQQGKPIGALADNEIVLTSWAAENLSVKPGDQVRITYFLPESNHGDSQEDHAEFTIKAIVPLTAPASPYLPDRKLHFTHRPTIANDPNLTPDVKGVTDQASLNDWEVPFVIDYGLIRPADDRYWKEYATTPKAFVSLATGRRLWGSRFGNSTSYRIPTQAHLSKQQIEQILLTQLAGNQGALGFVFRPIKRLQLHASSGNTPFDVLFLMLSFFIIAAALLLVVLLFRLGFEQRAGEAGLLLALGWNRRRLRRVLTAEAACVAVIGGGLGIVIGLGYAALILAALQSKSWWLGAIATPFLDFHYSIRSLVIGYTAGVSVSLLTIFWSVTRTRRVTARQMLSGSLATTGPLHATASRWTRIASIVLILGAIVLAIAATRLSGQAQAGAFVGAGAAILIALLLMIWQALRSGGTRLAPVTGNLPLLKLAVRSAARNPTRSTLTIGLIATASFLIVAMSAFQLKPTDSGTGGFSIRGESSQPIFADLNTADGRDELLADAAGMLDGCQVFSFRVRPGDDASCGNLYQATQPRILGVPNSFVKHFNDPSVPTFEFAASAAVPQPEKANPWQVLARGATATGAPIPVVIDKETAMYSLKLYRGIGEEFTFAYDNQPIKFRVVGLLSLSVLHGNLLISEADFRQLFPDLSGYRYTLIRTPAGRGARVTEVLEDKLSDQGFDGTSTERILSSLMALQNTYLRTFQTLGALGLLLGTFGLAATQFRSMLERRGEMALLRAAGFRRSRLGKIVLIENVLLLLVGLATGVLAALLAVLPHMFGGGAAIPFAELATMLGIVLLIGLAAGWLAARATLRLPVLAALREER